MSAPAVLCLLEDQATWNCLALVFENGCEMDPNQIGLLASADVAVGALIEDWKMDFSKVGSFQFRIRSCWRSTHNVRLEAERAKSRNSRRNHSLNFLLLLLVQSPYLWEKARRQQGSLGSKRGTGVVFEPGQRWNQAAPATESRKRSCGVRVQPVS